VAGRATHATLQVASVNLPPVSLFLFTVCTYSHDPLTVVIASIQGCVDITVHWLHSCQQDLIEALTFSLLCCAKCNNSNNSSNNNHHDDDSGIDNNNNNDNDDIDTTNNINAFRLMNELGTCRASLVSPKQPVLCIPVRHITMTVVTVT